MAFKGGKSPSLAAIYVRIGAIPNSAQPQKTLATRRTAFDLREKQQQMI